MKQNHENSCRKRCSEQTIQFQLYNHHLCKTTYKVRFCKQCFDKNERNKKIFFSFGKIIYVLLGLLLLYWMFTTDEKLGFTSVLGTIGMYGIIALCAIGWKDSVIENFFDTANIEEAYKDNAII